MATGEKLSSVARFNIEVMLANLEADPHLLDILVALALAVFLVELGLLVPVLAPVEDLGYRWFGPGSNFYQIRSSCGGLLSGFGNRNHSNLFAIKTDQPYLGCGDLLIQTGFWLRYC
jgi:hypothetical protein